ncbi:hypothetical protein [Halopelagius longus]|uniref:Uncharacterized protein n=1 Tax=Halopelagius longus TaxID=1236180 RepID=A0A1H0XTF8_9EURY|nr:hypothetical protein [Halopelagius longus]RDI72082.1 hypothetical protein DWB78_10315 [Halopelagius longus]SDQ06163.1 hypothetical protein SAMN05216278_0171 [Halopelagius longus]
MNRRDEPTSRTLSRRSLLSLSAAGAAALAGCGGTNARNDDQTATGEPTDDGQTTGASETETATTESDDRTSLGYVRVVNHHAESHTMHVLVERDGDVAFWSSYRLGTDSNETMKQVDGPWTDGRGTYTVHFRIDEREEWRTFDTGKTDFPCYGLEGRIGADGKLGVWVEDTPDACTTTATQE